MKFTLVPERHDLKDLCALNVNISEIEGLFACLHLIQTHTGLSQRNAAESCFLTSARHEFATFGNHQPPPFPAKVFKVELTGKEFK